MLIKMAVLDAIVKGEISLQFRRQKRPTVRAGGTLKTARGLLAIESVDAVPETELTADDAFRAGFASAAELVESMDGRAGTIYRVAVRFAGADPRIALRESDELDSEQLQQLLRRLERMDRKVRWTQSTLEAIERSPAVLAATLAAELGVDKLPFKANVRKLKNLGLTVSLPVGYELAPRGQALLDALRAQPKA